MNEVVTQRPTRTIANVPDGMQPMVLAKLVQQRIEAAPDDAASIVFVARDGRRLQRMAEILTAMLPGHTILTLPAWDCLPYDRVSPNNVTIAARMNTLAALTSGAKGAVVLTAVNALIQRLPPRDVVETMSFSAVTGRIVDSEKLIAWAANNGYLRVPTVRESGEYAVRGGRRVATAVRLLWQPTRIDPHFRSGHAAHHGPAQAGRPDADERGGVDRGHHPAVPAAIHGGLWRQHGRRYALCLRERRLPLFWHRALAAVLLRASGYAGGLCWRCPLRIRRAGG
jgi:hypothetical protein